MKQHGSFVLTVKDQTLIVQAIGAWNYETAASCGVEYRRLVNQISGKPWGCLVDLTEWGLFTPEASDYIVSLNEWGNQNNQRYEVVVCNISIQRKLLKKTHEVLTNVETEFCETREQAYQWLKAAGVMDS